MGLRYRRKVNIGPSTFLNISKSGFSTTFKPSKGWSVNFGKRGTFLNLGIPGSGLFFRERISSSSRTHKGFDESEGGCLYRILFTWRGFLSFCLIAINICLLTLGIIKHNIDVIIIGGSGIAAYILYWVVSWIGLLSTYFLWMAIAAVITGIIKHDSDILTGGMCLLALFGLFHLTKYGIRKTHTMLHTRKKNPRATIVSAPTKTHGENTIQHPMKKSITKDMVEKLLEPFEPVRIPIPNDADPLYLEAWQLVVEQKSATIVMLQRHLQISNVRAGRIINQLEQTGIVGKSNGSQPREVLQLYDCPWKNANPTNRQLITAAKHVISVEKVSEYNIQYKLEKTDQKEIDIRTVEKIIGRLEEAGIIDMNKNVLVMNDGMIDRILEDMLTSIAESSPNDGFIITTEDPSNDSSPALYDEYFYDAARLVVASQFGSTSLIQRKLGLGYNRAGLIIDQLEQAGIIGPYNGSKARDVLIHDEAALNELLRNL